MMTLRPLATIRIFLGLPFHAWRRDYDFLERVRPAYAVLAFIILSAMSSALSTPATYVVVRHFDIGTSGGSIPLSLISDLLSGTVLLLAEALVLWFVCRRFTTYTRAVIITAALATCRAGWGLIPLTPAAVSAIVQPDKLLYIIAIYAIVGTCLAIYFITLTFTVFRGALRISASRALTALVCSLLFVPQIAVLPDGLFRTEVIDEHKLEQYVRNHVIQSRLIASHALEPALLQGDKVIILPRNGHAMPAIGEVWVFKPPANLESSTEQITESTRNMGSRISRVAGLPGDHIELIPGAGLRRNRQMVQDWPFMRPPSDYFEITVPDGHVFVVGDNLALSRDSRFYGCIPSSSMIGQAVYIYYPFNRMGKIRCR